MNIVKNLAISLSVILLVIIAYYSGAAFLEERSYKKSLSVGKSYLNQVFKLQDESYFVNSLFYEHQQDENLKQDHLVAYRKFIQKFGKLVLIKDVKINSLRWNLNNQEHISLTQYFILGNFEQYEDVKFGISLTEVEDTWQFYGFSFIDENAPYLKQ